MSERRYLSSQHAAQYLDMTYEAFDKFVRREGVPHLRLGRKRLFEPKVLDDVVKAISLRQQRRLRAVS